WRSKLPPLPALPDLLSQANTLVLSVVNSRSGSPQSHLARPPSLFVHSRWHIRSGHTCPARRPRPAPSSGTGRPLCLAFSASTSLASFLPRAMVPAFSMQHQFVPGPSCIFSFLSVNRDGDYFFACASC